MHPELWPKIPLETSNLPRNPSRGAGRAASIRGHTGRVKWQGGNGLVHFSTSTGGHSDTLRPVTASGSKPVPILRQRPATAQAGRGAATIGEARFLRAPQRTSSEVMSQLNGQMGGGVHGTWGGMSGAGGRDEERDKGDVVRGAGERIGKGGRPPMPRDSLRGTLMTSLATEGGELGGGGRVEGEGEGRGGVKQQGVGWGKDYEEDGVPSEGGDKAVWGGGGGGAGGRGRAVGRHTERRPLHAPKSRPSSAVETGGSSSSGPGARRGGWGDVVQGSISGTSSQAGPSPYEAGGGGGDGGGGGSRRVLGRSLLHSASGGGRPVPRQNSFFGGGSVADAWREGAQELSEEAGRGGGGGRGKWGGERGRAHG